MDMNHMNQQLGLWMKSLAMPDEFDLASAPKNIAERHLGMQGIANAREFGGYIMSDGRKIKAKHLLRSANLHLATPEDVRRLSEEYQLKLIIDLRSESEHIALPDQKVDGAEAIWVNVLDNATGGLSQLLADNKELMTNLASTSDYNLYTMYFCQQASLQRTMEDLYTHMLSNDHSKKAFASIFQKILEKEGAPILWHCAQGKDRCGLTAILILGALGAGFNLMMYDFGVSNYYYKNLLDKNLMLAKENNCDEMTLHTINGLVGVNELAMQKAIDFMKKAYGSVSNYIREELGITIQELEMLRTWYLD